MRRTRAPGRVGTRRLGLLVGSVTRTPARGATTSGRRARSRAPLLLACSAALALGGCASAASSGRARTLESGTSQVGGDVELGVLTLPRVGDQQARVPWVQLGASYRAGVADDLELGGRVAGIGVPGLSALTVGGDLKWQLLRADGPRTRWDWALAPGASYQQVRLGDSPWHIVGVSAPLLWGREVGRHALVLGARLADQLWVGEGQRPINLFLAGGTVAFAARVGRRWEVMPELALMWSPVSFNGEVERRTGAGVLQLGLSISRLPERGGSGLVAAAR